MVIKCTAMLTDSLLPFKNNYKLFNNIKLDEIVLAGIIYPHPVQTLWLRLVT